MADRDPGRLRLPLHLKWSGPAEYDISDPEQRKRVYEIVLREGRAADIRRYVDLDELSRLWPKVFLPAHIRNSWEDYFSGIAHKNTASRNSFAREGRDEYYTTLTPLQLRLTRLFLDMPESEHFALAGGAALVIHRAVPRTTKDLDFFGLLAEEVQPAAKGFQSRLVREGLKTEVISSSPSFVRMIVSGAGGEEILVDIGRDFRLLEPDPTEIGPVLSLEELAADKLLALFSRAEARDFVDVFYLARRFGISAMRDWARQKDAGFDPYLLALGLGRLESLPRDEFEVEASRYDEMTEFFRLLRAELIDEAASHEP